MVKSEILSFLNVLKPEEYNRLKNHYAQILYTLEHIHYSKVLEDIEKRRSQLDIYKPNKFLSFYIPKGKDFTNLSQGCYWCLQNKISHIRHSSKCQLNCDFCYFHGKDEDSRIVPKWAYRESNTRYNLDLDEMKLMMEKQFIGKVKAMGWLEKEPLFELEKMEPLMRFIADNNIHQYLYTNGILADEETLVKLDNWGLNEIRFNLQATNFDENVLTNMELACDILETVCIETPMFSKTFNNFIENKDRILKSGIKQINIPELQLSPANFHLFKDEGQIYRHRRGYTSPVSSRHYVYDLIEIALKESWDVIINDCSNDTKFYRSTSLFDCEDLRCGISYATEFSFLPVEYYLYVLNNFVGEEMEFL